jgi:ribosomal protein L20A (L18A)
LISIPTNLHSHQVQAAVKRSRKIPKIFSRIGSESRVNFSLVKIEIVQGARLNQKPKAKANQTNHKSIYRTLIRANGFSPGN